MRPEPEKTYRPRANPPREITYLTSWDTPAGAVHHHYRCDCGSLFFTPNKLYRDQLRCPGCDATLPIKPSRRKR
jgi:hypothetical protein